MAFTTVKTGALEYLTAGNIAPPHAFTTRYGGVSVGYLASLNIGTHRGDQPENVLENYRILGSALGFSPENLVLTHQTHTDIVRRVGPDERGAGLFAPALSDCDGLITDTPGLALVVFSADCTPILLWDPDSGAVGAVHAGWRGTAAGIALRAVEAMAASFGSDPARLRCAIGPNIGPCCFETDKNVPDAMRRALGGDAEAAIRPQGDKYYVNLKMLNELWLRRAGVASIDVCAECTACQPEKYWSYRQMGDHRGSQGAVIVCKGATA